MATLSSPPEPATGRVIRPNPGAQERFLSSSADIAITGGKAGTGKTWSLLLEPLRHVRNRHFRAVTFRRTCPQITNPGGLWDKSEELYPLVGATPRLTSLDWKFPSGAEHKFAHMQHESDRMGFDGGEISLVQFDQLESFSARMFWHIISRSRSTCGVDPYVRATCNPDPDSFLRSFLSWWIDDASGYAIEERSGVIRWVARSEDDELHWADSAYELVRDLGPDCLPMSVTFIPGHLEENVPLLSKDPRYAAKLSLLPMVERERLRKGNWNIRYTAGTFFKREWFKVVKAAPICDFEIRYWDRAGTELKNDSETQSATAGVRMGLMSNGMIVVKHVFRDWLTPHGVDQAVKNLASQDGPGVEVWFEEDPGQAGKAEAQHQVRNLHGFIARTNRVHESKGTRARMFSAQAEAGNVLVVDGPWREAYLNELENFDGTKKCRSDQVDASSGGYLMLTENQGAGVW